MTDPTITILCPTRDRPEGAFRTLNSALSNATTKGVRVLFYVAQDDPQWPAYQALCSALRAGPRTHTSQAWNKLWWAHPVTDLYMLGSDDISFETPGWDERLFDMAELDISAQRPCVYHFRDSRHPTNTPHPIVTRAWTDLFGWFVPPQFNHYYVDSFTCWTAKIAGLFRPLPSVLLAHHKESGGRFPWMPGWLAEDIQTWRTSCPNMEKAVGKLVEKVYGE